MFRRKKKEEEVPPAPAPETVSESKPEEAPVAATETSAAAPEAAAVPGSETAATEGAASPASAGETAKSPGRSGNRVQKVGIVASDKMQKTVLVRVDRLVRHPKYRRYVRRTSKFMAHDDLGSTTGDRVRIVETRPLSARKRWRVVEIVQKAAK
ncbi:MAG: 30S ribosomal protein S17 [Acidobacteriota bacterium]